jgi:uncharacterized protein YecE (DUF72 family)
MLKQLNIPDQYAPYLRIGSCSWKFDSWKGLVYDPDKDYKPADYLADYSRYYNTVEIDQWFWSLFPAGVKLPSKDDARAYSASVPDDFMFSVKVPNSITLTHHYTKQTKAYSGFAGKPNPYFLDNSLFEKFLDTISPFENKLGPVIFQFEYLNRQKMPSMNAFCDNLNNFFEKAPAGFKYAVECRNPNYFRPGFFDFLSNNNLGFVLLDGYYMPPIGQLIASHNINTAGFTVARLQPRDRQAMDTRANNKWNKLIEQNNESIRVLADFIKANASQSIMTIINANNHYEGCAPMTIERIVNAL